MSSAPEPPHDRASQRPPITAHPHDGAWQRPPITARQRRIDWFITAALFVGALASLNLYSATALLPDGASVGISIAWTTLVTLPLGLRRRYPSAVMMIIAAAFIAGQLTQITEVLFANICLFVAIYTVGAWERSRRRAVALRVTVIAGMFIYLVIWLALSAADSDSMPALSRDGTFSPLLAFTLLQLITNLLYFGGAYIAGDRAYAAALTLHVLQERGEELARERALIEAQAVSLERLRIARELHDAVAHHVSIMGVQAGAARTVLRSQPDAAAEALTAVERGAREAIDELHGLLITLRDPTRAELPTVSGSTLGATSLAHLVEESALNGLPVTQETVGEPRPLPTLVSLTVYRVAQEALTNARKYGGPGATADVRLRYLEDGLELEVTNTGRPPSRRPSTGLGHVGMRERVAAVGGRIELGPRARGGYLVRAFLPLPVHDTAAPASAAAGSDETGTADSNGATP